MSKLKINQNKEKIVKLLNENIDLQYKFNLKRFHRISEEVKIIGSKKESKQVKIKIGHWFEWHKSDDENNPKSKGLKLERSEIIEIDGIKSDHWNRLTYYTVADV